MRKSFTNIFSVMLCTLGVSFAQAQTFSYTGSLQSITVPACADSVTITASGGEGGQGPYNVPGLGATITGTFAVSGGSVLNIVVGQAGTGVPSGPYYCGSGGGGSYVWNAASSAKPIIVAGGGGGSSYGSPTGGAGSADSIPTPSTSCAAGGMNGNGGVGGTCSAPVEGGGGAGWISNGDSGLGYGNGSQNGGGGLDPANGAGGGYAGNPGSAGGYGGGGGCAGNDGAGGGGGGYNGGGGGLCGGTGNWGAGGGGGSYNLGSNQTNTAGANSGNGSVIIKFNSSLNLTAITTGVSCNGGNSGSGTVTAACGTAPYTYNWSPSGATSPAVTGLTAGTYTVTVQDKNGLTSTVAVTVTQPAALTLIDTANSPSICKGSCTNINTIAFGGTAGYTYLWNTGATSTTINVCPTTTTTYTTTVTDANGCVHDTTTTVTIIPLPVVTLSAAKDSACVSSTTDALTASPVGGIFSGTGVTSGNFDPSVAGLGAHNVYYLYTDTLTGCTNVDTLKVFVQVCAGVNEVNALDEQVKFYPNPFSQNINVDISVSGSLTITMFNMLGENVGSWVMDKGLNTINTQAYPSGVYMIQVKSKDGLLNKKLVKIK